MPVKTERVKSERLFPEAPCSHPETVDWALASGPAKNDPRLDCFPCQGNHTVSSYTGNAFGVWLKCETCAFRLDYAPKMGYSGRYRKEDNPEEISEALNRLEESGLTPTAARVEGFLKQVCTDRLIEKGRYPTAVPKSNEFWKGVKTKSEVKVEIKTEIPSKPRPTAIRTPLARSEASASQGAVSANVEDDATPQYTSGQIKVFSQWKRLFILLRRRTQQWTEGDWQQVPFPDMEL